MTSKEEPSTQHSTFLLSSSMSHGLTIQLIYFSSNSVNEQQNIREDPKKQWIYTGGSPSSQQT